MSFKFKKKSMEYGRMIKFSHTVFALPFALSAVVLAWQTHARSMADLAWILVAMVAARSAAMGFNRIVDADIDRINPRTALREIPAGVLSSKEAVFFVVVSGLAFVGAAAMLSRLCFFLSFPVLFMLLFYSYTKRFTAYCHLYLGLAISLAPIGAWVALTDTLNWGVVFLSLSLMTYIAGFDILYACQDIDFDRDQGLHSLPARLGAQKAMAVSTLLHILTMIFFLAMARSFDLHPVFMVFLGVIGILLIVEHCLVRPNDLSQINMAFFNMNTLVSVCLFGGILVQSFFR